MVHLGVARCTLGYRDEERVMGRGRERTPKPSRGIEPPLLSRTVEEIDRFWDMFRYWMCVDVKTKGR